MGISSRTQPSNRDPYFPVLAVLLFSLILYTVTLAPDVLWGGGDFATFQRRAYLNEVVTKGDVFDHPLWVALAHPFTRLPLGNPAWRANLASAVFAAITLALVYLAAWRLTRSKIASLLAVGTLALSHTFWTYAVMPKVYSLNALFLALCCFLLLLWRDTEVSGYLYASALLFGLSFLNHLVMATALPAFGAFVSVRAWRAGPLIARSRLLLFAALFFVLGLTPYLWIVGQTGTTAATGDRIAQFAAGLQYAATTPGALLTALGWGTLLAVYQFPLTIPLGFLGLAKLWKKDRNSALLIGLGVAGAALFLLAAADPKAGGVYIWNLHYHLQGYVFLALAIAVGFQAVWDQWIGADRLRQAVLFLATLGVPIFVYAVSPRITPLIVPAVPDFRPLPGRDNFTYVLSPWKHTERGARPFGEQMLASLPADSVLFADYSIWAVLRYLQDVEGQRPDLKLIRLGGLAAQVETILAYQDHPRIFLADTYRYYNLEGIGAIFKIVPHGPVYRLVPRQTEGSAYP